MTSDLNFELKPNLPFTLSSVISGISSPSVKWRREARDYSDTLTKPPGSLGRLEELAAQVVAIRQDPHPSLERRAVYVFAADHGVTEEGVSAYPKEVTAQMVLNFLKGGAAINVLARGSQAEVVVVDVGVDADFPETLGVLHRKVRRGTHNMLRRPAMTEAELFAALQIGLDLAKEAHDRARSIVAIGEMGIGNTTAASAITAALTGESAARVTGSGTGVSGEALLHKTNVIDATLKTHFPDRQQHPPDPMEILRRVGGLELAAMTGMILGAASRKIPVVLDGYISTASAMIAFALQPEVKHYLFAGHQSTEPGHQIQLNHMGLEPLLRLGMRLGEGTGAVLAFLLIDSALRLHNEMATFSAAKVSGACV